MTGSLVDRATTDLLIGPDWAMNLEICDILNHNPGLAKDVVKGLKRRIRHKNPKVQLLALTLLETIIKNCGDMVHMHVAEKDLPHEMVKIVKRKPDFNVKEKILISIDTWQEAFGGPRARYFQFYAAYQELLRMGAVFPKRPETSAPFFTSPVKYPLSSYPKSPQSSEHQQEAPETSAGSDFQAFSLTDVQNARGVVDVLSEMLDALDSGNKEELRQDVILDLVQQCRSYRRRLVHLLNTTSDEDLLNQGLALHDDLQRVLAKHDALASGVAVRVEKTKALQALVDIDDPVVTNPDGSAQPGECASSSDQLPLEQLLLTEPLQSNRTAIPSAIAATYTDLLSVEDLNTPGAENQLALVPVGEPLASSATEQNALVLADVFCQNDSDNFNNNPTTPFDSLLATREAPAQSSNLQLTLYSSECIPNSVVPGYEQSPCQGALVDYANPAWNCQIVHDINLQQEQLNGANDGLPPPPWETQLDESNELRHIHPGYVWNSQQAGIYLSPMQSSQQSAMYTNSQPMQGGQTTCYNAYYSQRPPYNYNMSPNEISQAMHGLNLQDTYGNSNAGPSYQPPTTSYVSQFNRPSRPEDKLFGDLVNLAKTKQNKIPPSNAGDL